VRDTFESYLTCKDFIPLSFKRVINQGSVHSFHQYKFFPDAGKIQTRVSKNSKIIIKDCASYLPGSYDMLSSAYFFRSYDFEHMKKGQKIFFNMIVDSNNERLYFKYLGKEVSETDNSRKFMCHKICVWMTKGDFFSKEENINIWFTADKNRLPLRVDTKILAGSVHAVLLDVKNTRYLLTSEIK